MYLIRNIHLKIYQKIDEIIEKNIYIYKSLKIFQIRYTFIYIYMIITFL